MTRQEHIVALVRQALGPEADDAVLLRYSRPPDVAMSGAAKRTMAIHLIAATLSALGRNALALEYVSDPDAMVAEIAKTNPHLANLLHEPRGS